VTVPKGNEDCAAASMDAVMGTGARGRDAAGAPRKRSEDICANCFHGEGGDA
jgi:hypothetical protein